MVRTRSASSSTTTILRSLVSYPSGAMPPTQSPLRLEAAILSRKRSEVTSRSNWAKDNRTFRVSRPMEVVVLNCWVTDTNDTPWSSNARCHLVVFDTGVSDRGAHLRAHAIQLAAVV